MALNMDKLVKLVKSGVTSHTEAAKKMGLPVSGISSLQFSQALVSAGKQSKQPKTSKSVKNLRDNEGNRWELIAARIGTTVAEAKELYGPGAESSYAGRGRPVGGSTRGSGSGSAKSKTKSKAKSAAKAKTSAAKRGGRVKSGPARARTLAERRAARAGNPS